MKPVESNHTYQEYRKKYGKDYDKGYVLGFTEEQYKKYKRNLKVWKINNKYYEIPRVRFINRLIIGVTSLLVLGSIAPIYLYGIQTFNVNFTCEHCKVDSNNKIKRDREFNTIIQVDNGYEIKYENLEVEINGKKNDDCWTFSFQSNLKNDFKIKSGYIKSDVNVKIKATKKHVYKYGCAVDVTEVDQSSITFTPTQKTKTRIDDWQREAFPVDEDEELNFTFKAISGKTLPTNIGMWMNGRYGKEGVEVTFTYSNNNTECKVHVPPYVARDNLQFRCK